ncbi:MAG: hypothetical protein NUK65_07180 [Firmicutes bacterium]|nr:hypothetical protein [Bacillota bacterium]
MRCARCQDDILEGDECIFREQTLCEDCYIGAVQTPKTCDVAAVYTAKKHREATGQTGTDGLSQLQKEIYNYIAEHGQATKDELLSIFKIPAWDLEKQFTVLRHCELCKGKKDGERIVFVLFDA